MADTILTLDGLKEIFQRLTMRMIGLEETDKNAFYVRIAYAEDGQPAFKKTDNIIFVNCF